jgi:hypothetical protein
MNRKVYKGISHYKDMEKRIKSKSLISMGEVAFKILSFYSKGLRTSEITKLMQFEKEQNTQGYRAELIEAGWVIPCELGKCKLTEAGKYFLKTIYLNPQIRNRLK